MNHLFENRQFMIIDTSQVAAINFQEVLETSSETLRYSIDRAKTFVKWETAQIPTSVQNIAVQYKEGPYTYEEILEILSSGIWTQTGIEF